MKTTTKLELIDPARLVPSDRSPRVHSARQIEKLRASIRAFGVVSPVLVDKDLHIISHRAVVQAAMAEGVPAVPCVFVEHLDETQKKAYILADNRLAECSHWDDALVDACLRELFDAGFDLQLTGFGEYRLSDALAREAAPEPVDAAADCAPGDLWQLGAHRLLCGDATKPADVQRLMQGERAVLLLTDPPYNVDYHGSAGKIIANDNLPASRFQTFLTDALQAAHDALLPGAAFYIWYGAASTPQFLAACTAAGLSVRQYLVWVKNQFVLGRQDYNWQHEPCLSGYAEPEEYDGCLYGWDTRAPHRWYGGEGQGTVYFCDKPPKSEDHPTMKPVELFARQIRSSTRKGDILLDPFCGSGTSLLAAETYGRKCRAMELSPENCAVIVRRWEEMTGQSAKRLEGGAADGRQATAD